MQFNESNFMQDPRIDRLAQVLIHHSCRLQPGQKVLIEAFDLPEPGLVCRLVEEVCRIGATPVVAIKNNAVLRSLYRGATETSMKLAGKFEAAVMSEMDAYIGIRGSANSNEFADVPSVRRHGSLSAALVAASAYSDSSS